MKVDRKKIRFPKLKFKGAFHPTVIRKTPEAKKPEQKVEVVKEMEVTQASDQTPTPPMDLGSGAKEPKYNVKYRHTADLEDSAVYQVTGFSILFGLSFFRHFNSLAYFSCFVKFLNYD